MFNHLAADLGRCGSSNGERLREVCLNTGMWAVAGYRFRRWLFALKLPRALKRPLNFVAAIVQLGMEILTNTSLPVTAQIGPGLYIPHTGYLVISSRVVIGRNCTLTQGVTIGHGGGGSKSSAQIPVIGDRVYVGPGAAIIGPITIGDDALIGAGAVVTRSVPARGVVGGNPARLLSRNGSFGLISYPGMENDSARLESLMAVEQDSDVAGLAADSLANSEIS